ncbi:MULTISPECIES: SDR family oxidoreductase [Pseudomonas]|uniref:SDR family oxidoreductase n=1 Tax=Pseudomonas TaxID=286 RepID=UPI000D6ABA8C|nr:MULTISPECIES: SDR family oxidoreductase [Pseudomonas]
MRGPSPCSGGVQAESWGYCSSIYVHRGVLASNLQHDVTDADADADADATKSVVRKAVKQFGRLDVAFANAGISWRGAPATLRTYDEDEFERICAVDLNPQPTSVCRDGQQSPHIGHCSINQKPLRACVDLGVLPNFLQIKSRSFHGLHRCPAYPQSGEC